MVVATELWGPLACGPKKVLQQLSWPTHLQEVAAMMVGHGDAHGRGYIYGDCCNVVYLQFMGGVSTVKKCEWEL